MTTTFDTQEALATFHDFVEEELGAVFTTVAGDHFTSASVTDLSQEDALILFQKLLAAGDAAFLIFLEKEDWGIRFRGDAGACLYDLFCLPDEAREQATEDLFFLLEVY